MNEIEKFEEKELREKIYNIRGFQVMLDRDLAELYGVETRRINEQVKRNKDRFPEKYCFKLTEHERNELVAKCDRFNKMKHSTSLPTAFTEHGVSMLSSVLKSEIAIRISIMIIDAFIEMRKIIQSNGLLFQRMDNLEVKQIETDKKVEKILDAMESGEIKPKQKIFFENQAYDAYMFVSNIFRSAKKSIMIIDNYVNDSVLTVLSKRRKGVKAAIYTKTISDQLRLDVKKFNEQYDPVELIEFKNSHDRFIIIDDKIIYHFGASLKDLGRKWFGFSRMDIGAVEMLSRLGK
ncbi:MAG TPA: ORF6N domain-containing protein [Clostridiales bacterium]|nr:ORF6N domain-containing protein [Clostridiales bacterium]HQP69044.1 ORF6N domain-containing protein [Clostridiales bacterium]